MFVEVPETRERVTHTEQLVQVQTHHTDGGDQKQAPNCLGEQRTGD